MYDPSHVLSVRRLTTSLRLGFADIRGGDRAPDGLQRVQLSLSKAQRVHKFNQRTRQHQLGQFRLLRPIEFQERVDHVVAGLGPASKVPIHSREAIELRPTQTIREPQARLEASLVYLACLTREPFA